MFVDRVQIELQAGKGGDGCSSMRREKYVPRGGPDGGDGGRGASIILEAKLGVNSLAAYANRKFYRAPKGQPGQGSMCHGRKGGDQILYVPPGTTVIDAHQGFVIKDLTHHGESFVIARGGKGGRGNAHFKSSANQAPRESTAGEEGETRLVILELRSIADVGLVGKPNAGKSTLLSRISSARPEIADYPFTTKHPNLGIVEADEERSFVLADIPGLIEGASEGVGLGHEFLKHVERAGLLVHLVEPKPVDGTDPLQNYNAIRAELIEYDPDLGKRDEILVVTKMEMEGAEEVRDQLRESTGKEVFMISAATGEGLAELTHRIMDQVMLRRQRMENEGEVVPKLRVSDESTATRQRRVPPHLAGPTSDLSNEHQAKDKEGEQVSRKQGRKHHGSGNDSGNDSDKAVP
ncbi:GTPase ObgE [Stieleria varia]|uniref:GTPase Obg n=1 Tax=Stieleria varia TaxID=2528005 RepID=A0A5C6B9D6_9BACT|nr:GTPase ObgE [Stieleria varia]TWU07876.1 GTPase Obg [Stieleria varia]